MALPAATAPDLETYLDALDAALVGPRRVRRSLVQEASDHLDDAAAAYAAAGYTHDEGAALALADFGSVDEIAPAFQTTLAVAASRRTSWLLLSVLSPQALLWDGGLHLAEEKSATNDGALYLFLDASIEYVGMAVIVGALIALAATGIGNRWLRAGRGTARVTGLFSLVTCALVPLLAICLSLSAPTGHTAPMWGLMTVFLFIPMAFAARSARRTLHAC